MADATDTMNDDVPGPDKIDKQELVDMMALAISATESCNEYAMRKAGKAIEAFYRFRKGGDIHVQEGGRGVLEGVGEALGYMGKASSALRRAHDDLTRIQEYPDYKLPPPTRSSGVRPLGNSGGKNGSHPRKELK